VSAASIGAIQRSLLEIEQQGGEKFFGEPMLNIDDLIQTDPKGRGIVNVLVADELVRQPKLYATFLLWMLSELFEHLPEVGDPEKPTLVFFFDEAHLLFNDAPSALVEKVEQVVRLIRSKGVGVYFVTQSPADIPDNILGQLGNRVQHALRAFTPKDQKAVKTAAQTLRANPKVDIEKAIMELAVGEALVSMLDPKGTPQITWRAWMVPPCSQIGPISPADRDRVRKAGQAMYGQYEQVVDRESAYEKLKSRTLSRAGTPDQGIPGTAAAPANPQAGTAPPTPTSPSATSEIAGALAGVLFGTTGPRGGHHDGLINSAAKSAARSMGSGVGRAILRGALGSILGGSSRSR
jgi:DNA helicase HerA-like ATPase